MNVNTNHTLPYPIHVGRGLLAVLPTLVSQVADAHHIGIIADETVAPLYAARLRAALGDTRVTEITLPTGEAQKSRESWARITDTLLAARMGRDGLLIALGGGVIGDLAGFVAATYLRGIPVLQVPTTLLAMVDSSIGGKTGVDTAMGKNLVGAFHPPIAVVADVETLQSLPPRELRNGLAEAIKHGVIRDRAYFDLVISSTLTDADWPAIIAGSVAIKTAVVRDDEHENGIRKTLNFGHTIGHAIEHVLDYATPHGECVAIGMVIESRIAVSLGICDPALPTLLSDALQRVGLPARVPASVSVDAIVSATQSDKKARSGIVEYALPARCGAMAGADRGYGTPVALERVRSALLSA